MRSNRRRHLVTWPLAALALAGLVGLACRADGDGDAPAGTVKIGDIRWYVDYDAALEVAKEQDKALWVHFGENPG